MTEKDDVERLPTRCSLPSTKTSTYPERDESLPPESMTTAGLVFRRVGIDFVRPYNRLEGQHDQLAEPVGT
jgi:hypothetical protein